MLLALAQTLHMDVNKCSGHFAYAESVVLTHKRETLPPPWSMMAVR